jgi:glucan-binding YG repeat protein
MKPVIVVALLLLFGVTVPAFAQDEAKPAPKQDEAKPKKQDEPKPAKQEEAKPAKQEEAKPAKQEEAKPESKQQQSGHAQQSQGQYAKNGQKDSRGHEYSTSKFGPDHHARFVATGGRLDNGRREYSYGGYWFYAGAYPAWFYQQDVYFIMGADGLWYAVAYGNPSLTFHVDIA